MTMQENKIISNSIKTKKNILIGATALGVAGIVAALTLGSPAPNTTEVTNSIKAGFKNDLGINAEVNSLDIYQCKETTVRRMNCLVDADITLIKENGDLLTNSTIKAKEVEYKYIDGKFENVSADSYLDPSATDKVAGAATSMMLKGLFGSIR